MNSLPTILLTGFTGVLGKRFAYRLAALGHRVVCPIRAGSEAETRTRFEKIFHELAGLLPGFDPAVEARIQPIPGDVRKKGLGIPAAMLDELRGPRTKAIWHLAALLDLTESKSQDVYDTNLLGTLGVLDFAREQGIRELNYFSTFGSSGKLHEGIAREIPGIRPPAFRNTYERTKWEAERHVWQRQIRGEISATIYRPSIVVGDSVLGRYEQFNVFNHPFDIVSRVRTKLCDQQGVDPKTGTLKMEMRVPGDEKATLNIVPLDFVIDTVMKINAVPGSNGRVYHIVNPDPPSLRLAMDIFKQNEPWDGLRWEVFGAETTYLHPFEKFVAKQLGFLMPYLLGEAVYDYSNVQTALAFHGGMPPLKNEIFLDAISKRGIRHGWQEVKANAEIAALGVVREQLDSGFVWPEGSGLVVDFSPHHPVGEVTVPSQSYSFIERVLGKVYQARERISATVSHRRRPGQDAARDLVLVPFGMGVTRRGEAEACAYQHAEQLTDEVFMRMNQVAGFDLRAFARGAVPNHEAFGDIHDNCCWAVADDLVHLIRLFRDIQRTGAEDILSRLQILPHSGGTYLAGWLAGVLSFQDMALVVHQCASFLSENVKLRSRQEVEQWFFNPRTKCSEAERDFLNQIRARIDPAGRLDRDALVDRLQGRLELVFSLNARVLENLIAETRENRIGVALAIRMSPNTSAFTGNELEMARFDALFAGKRKIELRRVPIDVKGTPHCNRLNDAARHAGELLHLYDRQGRLRDPVIPFLSYDGEMVRTREDFIRAVAGIANHPMNFDRMVAGALEEGGRHFLMIQSGMSSTAGDLFEGILRSQANAGGFSTIHIHPPAIRSRDPHPICGVLNKRAENCVPDAMNQSLTETIRWYEKQLANAQTATARK